MLCFVQTCSEVPIAADWAVIKLPDNLLMPSPQRKDNPGPKEIYGE